MSEIDEFERRIAAALDRIGAGVDALVDKAATPPPAPEPAPPPPPEADPEELARLKAALEEERLANAQLEERVRAIKDRQESRVSQLEARAAEDARALAALDEELQKLRKVSQQLRDSNAALREANAEGLAEPHLINKAMLAELEALRVARTAEAAETEAILRRLEPLVSATRKEDA